MTTSNAMHERDAAEEMRRLKLENTVLKGQCERFGEQNGALIEEVEKLRMQLKDWKERLEHTQDALKEVVGARIAEMESHRSKMVLAEQKAIMEALQEMSGNAGKNAGLADNAQDRVLAEERERAYATAALMVRTRMGAVKVR